MRNRAEIAESLFQEAKELLDADQPSEAVKKARTASDHLDNSGIGLFNLASILFDAGGDTNSLALTMEAIEILEAIKESVPDQFMGNYHYNIGSGYSEAGKHEEGIGPGTKPSIAFAISHLDEALQYEPNAEIHSNLARALLIQGRCIEAFDEFSIALELDPQNHNALALRGSCLMGLYNWTSGHKGLLIGALHDKENALDLANSNIPSTKSYTESIENLRKRGITPHKTSTKKKTPVQQWIWQNRLGLSNCPICMDESPNAFDIYPLALKTNLPDKTPRSEEMIEIMNSLCRSYSTARWSLYKANTGSIEEEDQVITLQVSSETQHDIRIGLVMASISGFYSLLGQVAFGMNSYFKLGHKIQRVNLERIWCHPDSKSNEVPKIKSEIHTELTKNPSSALSALHALTLSIDTAKGRYGFLRDLRNRIEHRIVIPSHTVKDSEYYSSVQCSELESAAFKLGRIAKAAIWYFGGAIHHNEISNLKTLESKGIVPENGLGISVERV